MGNNSSALDTLITDVVDDNKRSLRCSNTDLQEFLEQYHTFDHDNQERSGIFESKRFEINPKLLTMTCVLARLLADRHGLSNKTKAQRDEYWAAKESSNIDVEKETSEILSESMFGNVDNATTLLRLKELKKRIKASMKSKPTDAERKQQNKKDIATLGVLGFTFRAENMAQEGKLFNFKSSPVKISVGVDSSHTVNNTGYIYKFNSNGLDKEVIFLKNEESHDIDLITAIFCSLCMIYASPAVLVEWQRGYLEKKFPGLLVKNIPKLRNVELRYDNLVVDVFHRGKNLNVFVKENGQKWPSKYNPDDLGAIQLLNLKGILKLVLKYRHEMQKVDTERAASYIYDIRQTLDTYEPIISYAYDQDHQVFTVKHPKALGFFKVNPWAQHLKPTYSLVMDGKMVHKPFKFDVWSPTDYILHVLQSIDGVYVKPTKNSDVSNV